MENNTAFTAILHRWKIVLALTLLGGLVGLGVAATATRQYKSSAELFLSVQSAETTGEISQTSQYSQDQATNFAEMAASERVLAPTIKAVGLQTTVRELATHVAAEVPLKSSAISLTVTYPDPAKAAAIANAAAAQLSEMVSTLSPKVNSHTSPVVLTQVDTATPATAPSSPSFLLDVVGGLVVGGLLGSGLALVLSAREDRRRDALVRVMEKQ